MTFMFQFPQFIPIKFSDGVTKKFPYYNLYAYGEGHYTESLRAGDFIGVPILFVPGNGGSFKQVRSLASVALRMSETFSTPFHFDYFTIDYNEELSAVYGDLLHSQTAFLNEAIKRIIKLYKSLGRNISLILIGHSIGGVVTRAVFSLPNFKNSDDIGLLITLASPHKYPVIPLDNALISFHRDVNDFWKLNRHKYPNINIISIGGGFNDKLVRSDLTLLPIGHSNDHSNDLNIITTSVEDVWASTDHLCIVWCRQLVLKLNRLLFDLTDGKSLMIKKSDKMRNDIIKYHLTNRLRSKDYPNYIIGDMMSIPTIGESIEMNDRIIRVSKSKILNYKNILLPLNRRETIVILYEGFAKYDWMFACNATIVGNQTQCDFGMNLYSYTNLMPSHSRGVDRRILNIPSMTLLNMGYTHLLMSLSPSSQPMSIMADRFTTVIRSKTIVLPSTIQSITMIFSPVTILHIPISAQTTYYNLSLTGLKHVWHAYWIQFDTLRCYRTAKEIGYLHFVVPWHSEDQYKFVIPKKSQSIQMTLKVNVPRPLELSPEIVPHLYIIVDSDCEYRLQLKPSISEIIGQILRHYGGLLLPMIVSVLISTLADQMSQTLQHVNSLSDINPNSKVSTIRTKYYYLQTIAVMGKFTNVLIYGLIIALPLGFIITLRYYDMSYFNYELTDSQFIVLYSFLYFSAYSIAYFFILFITIGFELLTSIVCILKIRIYGSEHTSNRSDLNYLKKPRKIQYFPIILSLILVLLCIIFNSSLSLLCGLIIHHIQLFNLCIKCDSYENLNGLDAVSSHWHLHLTLLALIYFSIIPTIPILLTWVNLRFPYFYFFFNDPHIVAAIFQSLAYAVIWQRIYDINTNKNETFVFALIIKIIAIAAAILGYFVYSFIPILISFSSIIIIAQQILMYYRFKDIKHD